jgi:predicted NUDIX family NTP pyrophosphohydrolase
VYHRVRRRWRSVVPARVTIEAMSKVPKQSAGLLMFRLMDGQLEVFLVHPGGPFWVKKDQGAWGIPKGEYGPDEEPLAAARREFIEETGFAAAGPFFELGSVRQKSGKVVTAWAFEGNCDPSKLVSNTCEIKWPPRSEKKLVIPEVDRGDWFSLDRAEQYVREEQVVFLERLAKALRSPQPLRLLVLLEP